MVSKIYASSTSDIISVSRIFEVSNVWNANEFFSSYETAYSRITDNFSSLAVPNDLSYGSYVQIDMRSLIRVLE